MRQHVLLLVEAYDIYCVTEAIHLIFQKTVKSKKAVEQGCIISAELAETAGEMFRRRLVASTRSCFNNVSAANSHKNERFK